MNIGLTLKQHFQISKLSDITWAHAVNSEAEFSNFLNDGKTLFIETDVGLSSGGIPILVHPPETESNITLESMLDRLKHSKQGIKLDFKVWTAAKLGLPMLADAKLEQPVILNADIIRGNGAKEPTIPAEEFIALCQSQWPTGILSLGWTTEPKKPYTAENIDQMIRRVKDIETILFPVRSSLVKDSWDQLERLTPDSKPNWLLSFWNTKEEVPTPEFINWLKNDAKPKRAIYDLIDKAKRPISV